MNVLIFLNDEYLVVAEQLKQSGGQGVKLTAFDSNDLDVFKDYLMALPQSSVLGVLLDYIDEDIKTLWYPKLLPWEKPALEKRQVQKVYADGAAFVNFLWKASYRKSDLGRDEQEARISAITKSDLLSQLFHFFNQQSLVVKSIYSATFLIEGFYASSVRKALQISAKQAKQSTLLLFRESQFVFRQVLLSEGVVKLTRLIEVDNNLQNDSAIMVSLVDEAAMIVRYIYNQKFLKYNAPVGMVYLDDDAVCREMFVGLYREKVVQGSWDLKNLVIDGLAYQKLVKPGQYEPSGDSFRQVLANYVFNKTPPSFYQNALTKKNNQLLNLRIGFSMIAVLIFSFGIYYNAKLLIDTSVLHDSTDTLAAKISQYQREIKKIEQAINIKFDAEDIKQIVDFSNKMVKPKTEKRLGFDLIAFSEQVLEIHSEIQITKIQWKLVGPYDTQSLELVLNGELGSFHGSFKPPFIHLDAFVADVKKFPNVKNVELIKSPLELDVTKSFALSLNEAIVGLPFSLSFEVAYVEIP